MKKILNGVIAKTCKFSSLHLPQVPFFWDNCKIAIKISKNENYEKLSYIPLNLILLDARS
ncbi:hypothetical protein PGB90_009679 [Kerria lacca]